MSELIERWKSSDSVKRFRDSEGNEYGIRIIGNGSNLFFQENDNALICSIDAVNAVIYSKSIKCWDGCEKMKKREKERVVGLIEHYYQSIINPDVSVI